MPGEIFNAGDILNKTLIAKVGVPVYRQPVDGSKPFGTVKAGQPVGVVYAWLDPKPPERAGLWWSFYDGFNQTYFTPHKENIFDVNALRQQGVISTEEKVQEEQEKEDLENLPWYERLIKKYGTTVVLALLGAAVIKGYFSRPSAPAAQTLVK